MKTRAFKKVLSIVCVLAMIMSVCVVSLVGSTSAAETYTFSVNGTTYEKQLNEGDPITEVAVCPGVDFLGWYEDAALTIKAETAGAAKTLYAKFSALIIDFENNKGVYDPNNNVGIDASKRSGPGDWWFTDDPTNADNRVLATSDSNGENKNFAIEAVPGSGTGFKPKANTKYEIRMDVYSTVRTKFNIGTRYALDGGIGEYSNKTDAQANLPFEASANKWVNIKATITTLETMNFPYLIFLNDGPEKEGMVYIDNIIITELPSEDTGREYTLYNKGVKSTITLNVGDTLPTVRGLSFEGWYDQTLTYKYADAPASVSNLVAKFSSHNYDFEDEAQIYLPNGNNDKFSYVADPDDGNNHVIKMALNSDRKNFGVVSELGTNVGLTLVKGQVYTISFKYKVSGINDTNEKFNLQLMSSKDAGVANDDGDKIEDLFSDDLASDVTGWTNYSAEFTLEKDISSSPNLLITVMGDPISGTVYIDDLTIAAKLPGVSSEDVVMDFEDDDDDNAFEWSVADANNYTVGSGNGYVNRGEIVEEAGNKFFRVKHFGEKNANIYFTIDNGKNQFKMVNYGVYTISFDYKVEHSETPSKIGLVLVEPTTASTGYKYQILETFEEFENRDDQEWSTISYTFGANLSVNPSYSSLGIFVFNSTNVPEINIDTNEATATSVLFDNIVVNTHTATGEDGMIVFDSVGGEDCVSIVGPAAQPVGTLPEPTRYGYKFIGWKYDVENPDSTITTYDLTKTTAMPDFITYAYATWQLDENAVEIVLRSNVSEYDAQYSPIIAFKGKPVVKFPTEDPTAAGQKFIGWYTDTTFTKKFDPSVAPDKSITLYAKWESAGDLIDFENYPQKWFNAEGQGTMAYASDRFSLVKEGNNQVLCYDFSKAGNKSNTTSHASAILHDGTKYFQAIEGMTYQISFKYKVVKGNAASSIGFVLSAHNNTWLNRAEQNGSIFALTPEEDAWKVGTSTFTAAYDKNGTYADGSFIAIGVSNDCMVYIDDVVVKSPINYMNVYGTAILLNTNGGKLLEPVSGDPGTKIKLPTPSKPGYKFAGWFVDAELTTPFTETVYGEEEIVLYAKWHLGKFTEDFENFPATVKALGVAGAYSFYTDTVAGFDATNVYSGKTSLFRNGNAAGVKHFTCMRNTELALNVGDTYTLSFYVKPTSVSDAEGVISMVEMSTYTGIAGATVGDAVVKISELKEGEWNLVTYTFTAKSPYIGLSTDDGNDMYFDDITVTLKGYTGAATGDSSVNPVLVVALILLCAGALLVTAKKVFSK